MKRDEFLWGAIAAYVTVWIALAIKPLDRQDWLLENMLVFVAAIVLVATYGRFRFSNTSYVLILAFLAVHAIGAHYTYSKVPAGFWVKDWFDLQRNHYDRLIHFGFGFLLLYPMSELMICAARAHARWGPWLAFIVLTALSAFFEIVEGVVAQIVSPELGTAYLGTQGDIWDAQKDMVAAFIGALIVALFLTLKKRRAQSAGESM